MTINGWCKTNYHKDGKRRYGELVSGLCLECQKKLPKSIEEQIDELLQQRAFLNTRLGQLRKQLLSKKGK